MKSLNLITSTVVMFLGMNAMAILPGPTVKVATVKAADMDESFNLGIIEDGQITINLTDSKIFLSLVDSQGNVVDHAFQIVDVRTNLCGAKEYHAVGLGRLALNESFIVSDYTSEICKIKRKAKTQATYETYEILSTGEEQMTRSEVLGTELIQIVY